MLRKQVTGTHKKQTATVVNWLAIDQQGLGKEVIDVATTDPNFPIEYYGARDAIRITDYEEAKDWADRLGFDTDWL